MNDQIEAAAEAMYEDFRLSYQGRYEKTPSWARLAGPAQDEWRRHSRVALAVFSRTP